jgi:hypothetical protein
MTNYFPKQSVKSKNSLLSSIHELYLSWAAQTCHLGQNVERGSRWESLVKMFLWQHTSSNITYEFTVGIFWWSGNWMYYLIIGHLVKFYLWQLTSSKITQELLPWVHDLSNIFDYDDVTKIISKKCFNFVEFDLKSIPLLFMSCRSQRRYSNSHEIVFTTVPPSCQSLTEWFVPSFKHFNNSNVLKKQNNLF